MTKLQCGIRENVNGIGDLTDSPKFGNGSKIGKEYDVRNSRMKEVRLHNSREKGAGMHVRPGARFSKVPIINGPGKLSRFPLKIEVSIVLHLA